MKMFIDKGVVATYTDILNQTVLYYAAREGKTNCIDMLLKLGIDQ
jgi:ankyrin repeat protein